LAAVGAAVVAPFVGDALVGAVVGDGTAVGLFVATVATDVGAVMTGAADTVGANVVGADVGEATEVGVGVCGTGVRLTGVTLLSASAMITLSAPVPTALNTTKPPVSHSRPISPNTIN
jgi:hypothetical protein